MNASTIINSVKRVTAKWAKQRKAEERQASARHKRSQALIRTHRVTTKEAAGEVMETAYLKASDSPIYGRVPTTPRQIYYQARPYILDRTGKETLDGQYFSQTLLVNYMAENPRTTATWDIIWDDRGHLAEPHTGKVIGLGTLAVREYLKRAEEGVEETYEIAVDHFPTLGPRNRFQAILFIEKEGFLPLFEAVQLAERYDLAIMSTKGLSTIAARNLIDVLCKEIPLLVLHDFDKSGFSIIGTLTRDTQRYQFRNDVNVIDLGLRLADVRKHELESEFVGYGKSSDPAPNLMENGATEEEIKFLRSGSKYVGNRVEYHGKRVELNAFPSGALIAWIEKKLQEHRIKKVIPDAATLERAYRRAVAFSTLPRYLAQQREAAVVPPGLVGKVQRMLRDDPKLSWDAAVNQICSTAKPLAANNNS